MIGAEQSSLQNCLENGDDMREMFGLEIVMNWRDFLGHIERVGSLCSIYTRIKTALIMLLPNCAFSSPAQKATSTVPKSNAGDTSATVIRNGKLAEILYLYGYMTSFLWTSEDLSGPLCIINRHSKSIYERLVGT